MTTSIATGAIPMTADERAALQHRTLRVLASGQVVGAAALASAVTVGAFVIQGILGKNTPWAGAATATVTTGTAFMVQLLSRVMQRKGRRVGLQYGYGLAVVGGLIAALGVERNSLAIFVGGLFLYGNGQAANLLSRYAATDLAEPHERGAAMSKILFASTFGAVLGPVLVGPLEHAGQSWFGLHKYTGPWLFSSLCFIGALINTAVRLRPDPLVVSGGISQHGDRPQLQIGAALAVIGQSSMARLAVFAMVISQVTMVAVMAMTPVHLKLHGHEGVSQYVISLHIAGMYAFSPLVGRFCDRRSQLKTIYIGAMLLVAATLLASLSGDVEQLLFPSLWLLGIGWSFGIVGGSSLLIDSIALENRVAVQGVSDLLMSFCGGMAGFSSGFIRRAVGFHLLASFAMIAAGFLVAAAYFSRRLAASHTTGRALAG